MIQPEHRANFIQWVKDNLETLSDDRIEEISDEINALIDKKLYEGYIK